MEQVKALDTHQQWKHVATGNLYTLMGYGLWKGGVNEDGVDGAAVIVARDEDSTQLRVVPGHYTIANVRSADAAVLQTSGAVTTDTQLAVYNSGSGVFARPTGEFFDGRFVKVDEKGNELAAPAKKPAKPGGEPSQG